MFGSSSVVARRVVVAILGATLIVAGTSVAPSGATPTKRHAAKATGDVVKVGLITTGGECDGCSAEAAFEEAAAEAAVNWLNAEENGLGGHKMELVTCVEASDPGKAADCANQMVRDGVVAVIEGSSGQLVTAWKILHDAGIPFINHSSTDTEVLGDPDSTFILYDPNAQTVTLPIQVAKQEKAKKVSYIVIDVPAATDIYDQQVTKDLFKKNKVKFETVPVAIGTADMSNEAQQIVADNPKGVVTIIGHDAFCIPALNALNALGYQGTITTISFCITDAMREAVPASVIDGMRFGSEAPVGAKKTDPSMKEYAKILKKYGGEDVDPEAMTPLVVFQSFGALGLGTKTLKGEVTPAAVIAALRAMDNEVLPASGGRIFRCNGKASSAGTSVCSRSTVVATLDETGNPQKYVTKGNDPIPD